MCNESCSTVGFEDTDLAFISAVEGPVGRATLTYIFCKRTSDEAFFNNMLAAFYTTPRKAYINEVYAVMSLPIFTEGPAVIESGTGKSCVRSREFIGRLHMEELTWKQRKQKVSRDSIWTQTACQWYWHYPLAENGARTSTWV